MAALEAIDSADIRYCILRNHEEIPVDPGRDIDLIVADEELDEIERLLRPIAERFEWPVLVRCRGHHEGTSYYFLDPTPPVVRQLELHFTRVRWARLPVLTPHRILADRELQPNGLWVAPDHLVAVQRLVQFGLAGGLSSMKPTYWEWLVEYGKTNGEALNRELIGAGFSRTVSSNLLESLRAADAEELDRRLRRLRPRFVSTRLLQAPPAIIDVARLVAERLRPDRQARCGVVVSGADDPLLAAIRPMFLDVTEWDGSHEGRRSAVDTLARAGLVLLDRPPSSEELADVTVDVSGLPATAARAAITKCFADNHDLM